MSLNNVDTQVKKVIINCLNEIGIVINLTLLENDDVNLDDYQLDSLTFISFLVDIEERLNIVIPDDYLDYNILQSLTGFINLISQLVEDSQTNLPTGSSD